MKPMLAEPGVSDEADAYIADNAFTFEQKVDGHRKLVVVEDGRVTVLGRDGQIADMPRPIVDHFRSLAPRMPGTWAFDGEIVPGPRGDFHLFDLPCAANRVTFKTPWVERRAVLGQFYGRTTWPSCIRLLPWATTPVEKRALHDRVKAADCEGLIAKRTTGCYVQGPRRNPDVVKLKFRHDVDCIVTAVRLPARDGRPKDNMAVSVYDAAGELVRIGEVTALAGDGARILELFDQGERQLVVTVKYQHFTNDGDLFQPTLPRLRWDKSGAECTADQLIHVNKEVLA